MKRVAIFIDGLNVRNRLKECGWEEFFDVGHLAKELAGPRQLVSAYYYHAQPNQEQLGPKRYAQERSYLERVRKAPQVVVPAGAYMAKRTRRCHGKDSPPLCSGQDVVIWIEKLNDVLLASDLVYMAAKGQMDVALLLSADADLVPAIRRCQDLSVPVELFRFRGSQARLYELEQAATSFRRARPQYFKPYLL